MESTHDVGVQQFLIELSKPQRGMPADARSAIEQWINEYDAKLSWQLNEVMHHPLFQRLEATWRGLKYLVDQSETGPILKLCVLNATKRELLRDLERAVEFDQSRLFKKIYDEEYGICWGQPYGALLGDYEFAHGAEDVTLLRMMSYIAAVAHAPFITNPSPRMFGFERFTELNHPRDLAKIFDGEEYQDWKSFRESEESRYVAMTMPKVLGRLPYGKEFRNVAEFNYEEMADGEDHDKYLWMGAAWAYGTCLTHAYAEYGWFMRTRGVEGGGKVEGLPVHTCPTDEGDVAMKCPTEIAINDRREFELSNLGFLPLLHVWGQEFAVFWSTQSVQKPKNYIDMAANANAELSTKLNYTLCVSRFIPYLKIMARDLLTALHTTEDVERLLNNWIKNYVLKHPSLRDDRARAEKPLADAWVDVRATKDKSGMIEVIAYLRAHFQCEGLSDTISMRLIAAIPR